MNCLLMAIKTAAANSETADKLLLQIISGLIIAIILNIFGSYVAMKMAIQKVDIKSSDAMKKYTELRAKMIMSRKRHDEYCKTNIQTKLDILSNNMIIIREDISALKQQGNTSHEMLQALVEGKITLP